MRRNLYIVALLFISTITCFAQQDEQVSLIYYDHMAINPGFAGNKNAICTNAIVRNQWLGFAEDGGAAMSTQIFSINAPFKLLNMRHGAGLTLKNDMIANSSNILINFAYAYNTEIAQGNLGIGVDFGFWSRTLDASSFYAVDNDPFIPTQEVSDMVFDLGLGIFYKADNLFLGISGKHLNAGNVDYAPNFGEKIAAHFYITGGYTYQLSNPLFEVEPTIHLKSGGPKAQITYGTRVLYNKKMWGGVSYNHEAGINTMFGMELPSGLKFAIAYEIPLSKVGTFGTPEIMIGYCFNLSVEKTTPSYKSVRFL